MSNKNELIDEENPWKTLSSKIVYENRWMRVREDQVINPSGGEGIYAFVANDKAVGAVVLNEKNEIYLVGQYRYTMKEYSWELIEGGVEEGEDYLQAIKRELKEEAGIEAKRFDVLHENLHLSNCFTAERGAMFLVRDIKEGKSTPESTEKLNVKRIPFDEAYTYALNGKIKDAYTIVGIILAKEFLEKEKSI